MGRVEQASDPWSWGPNLAAASPAGSREGDGGMGAPPRGEGAGEEVSSAPPPPTRPAPRPPPLPRPRARSGFSSHLVPFPFLRGPAPGALLPPPCPRPARPISPPGPLPAPAHLPSGRGRRRLPSPAGPQQRQWRRQLQLQPRDPPPPAPAPPAPPRALTAGPRAGAWAGAAVETPRAPARLSERHPFRLSGFPCARPLGRERGGHVVGGGRVRPGAEGVGRRGEERG